MIRSIILRLVFVLFAQSCFGDGLVWKATNGKNEIYLGGTFHMLKASDYPLPPGYEQAYKNSQILVFETDIDSLHKPEIQMQMLQYMVYQDGNSLEKVLSEEVYKKLAAHLGARGMHIATMTAYKPSFVTMMMMVMDLKALGVQEEYGVDRYFSQKATLDGKRKEKLEEVLDQFSFIANVGTGKEDRLVIQSIEESKALPTKFSQLVKAWKKGDERELDLLVNVEMKRDYPNLYNTILVERNNRWMPKIESLLQTPGSEFVLVGAAHLVGKDGVVSKLKAKGIKVEKFYLSNKGK